MLRAKRVAAQAQLDQQQVQAAAGAAAHGLPGAPAASSMGSSPGPQAQSIEGALAAVGAAADKASQDGVAAKAADQVMIDSDDDSVPDSILLEAAAMLSERSDARAQDFRVGAGQQTPADAHPAAQ